MKLLIIAVMLSAAIQVECAEASNSVANMVNDSYADNPFPTRNDVLATLQRIDLKFVASESGRDNWKEFLPLLEQVVKSQLSVSNRHEMVKVESVILEWMTLYAFACEYDFDEVKANFDSRIACIDLECQLEYVRTDTNAVMMIADWLGGAQPIVVDKEIDRQRRIEQFTKDKQMIYGEKFRPWGVGSFSYMGGLLQSPYCWSPYLIRELKAQHFRRRYNERLPDFRSKAEARMRRFVFEDFKAKDKAEREALWAEFCRRAKFAAQ